MSETNFLIGRGELLTYDIKGPKRGGEKVELYTLEQARGRLTPQFKLVSDAIDKLPDAAFPGDIAVAKLTMNPGYIAKSYFPAAMLRASGLESVGSRHVTVTPQSWTRKGVPEPSSTLELFVAGRRDVFKHLPEWAASVEVDTREALDLAHVEIFSPLMPDDRIRRQDETAATRFFEVGVHLFGDEDAAFVQNAFKKFAAARKVKVHGDLSFLAGNLWFVPVEGARDNVHQLAEFSLVRVVRPMPKLRGLRPVVRATGLVIRCRLPNAQPLSSEPKVAILDGGLPDEHTIGPWLRAYKKLDDSAANDADGIGHGLAVTSAFLFGPISPNDEAPRPFSFVDHLRVLDSDSATEHPLELYRTLGFVEQVLLSRQYNFVNLSLGPDLPIEDNDVHAWTSVIDELLSDGNTFMTVAAGNNGERDAASGNARVQVPSDCVNALAIGATSSVGDTWCRAPYSAIGPGRSPGVVKPDLVAFGGDPSEYFHALAPGRKPSLIPERGTSFAAPYALRSAVGVRAILGSELSPLAIKALLVHGAQAKTYGKFDVGWGKVPEDVMELITCPEGVARVVYQGELKPGKFLRAELPLPKAGLQGKVRIKATFCYACPVDPQDAAAYTRAGLEVVFRPSSSRQKAGKQNADTRGFFDMKTYATEHDRRQDMGKWETVLHGDKGMLGSSLSGPVFDVHYNAREGAGKPHRPDKIPYALVITVEAKRHPDLYNEILRAYPQILIPIQPQITLPVRVGMGR